MADQHHRNIFFTEIAAADDFCEAEELYGLPGIDELEDDVFPVPSDFIPVLAAAFDDYDGDDEDVEPAEWQPAPTEEWRPAPTALRPYRPDVEPISPASPIAIPPANFLPPPASSPFTIPPANFIPMEALPPPSPFYLSLIHI